MIAQSTGFSTGKNVLDYYEDVVPAPNYVQGLRRVVMFSGKFILECSQVIFDYWFTLKSPQLGVNLYLQRRYSSPNIIYCTSHPIWKKYNVS